ncbi:MAG: 50S ribosomal protein L10 [Bdellovibrionaceae bacterium]|nr:50S ribosomal protein L10 [Pseudobdellovibrionaceae bacterium]MDW8190082.1 50S ribosomal protein L10 [Pseudobdellovibrionaceae bacterium]
MVTREDKARMINQVADSIKKSKAFFLVDFKGLKVDQVTQLRKKLYQAQAEMKVTRNTLALRALDREGIQDQTLRDAFVGTNAFVFAYQDVASVAKSISDFAKDLEIFKVKAGFMEGRILASQQIAFLASLPPLEVMRAQFLGVLNAPAARLARTLNEVPASLARVLQAKVDATNKEGNSK